MLSDLSRWFTGYTHDFCATGDPGPTKWITRCLLDNMLIDTTLRKESRDRFFERFTRMWESEWDVLVSHHFLCRTADTWWLSEVANFGGNTRNEYVLPDVYTLQIPFLLKTIFGVNGSDIKKTVTFISVDYPMSFRIACDFCSIMNGILHVALDDFRQCPSKSLDTELIDVIGVLLYDRIRYRSEITTEHVSSWIEQELPGVRTSNSTARSIAFLYITLEQVELRWCPFKRCTEYYRFADPRYTHLPSMHTLPAFVRDVQDVFTTQLDDHMQQLPQSSQCTFEIPTFNTQQYLYDLPGQTSRIHRCVKKDTTNMLYGV